MAGRNFAAERSEPGSNVFEAVTKHVEGLQAAGKRVVIALWSEGSRERMGHVLAEHGLLNLTPVAVLAAGARVCRGPQIALAVLGARGRLRDRRCRAHQRAGHSGRSPGAPAPAIEAGGEFHRRGDEPFRRRPRRPCRSRHRPLRRAARHRGGGRAARLPGDPLRGRRQAVPAGREHRTAVALRLGGGDGRPRPARRRPPGRRARRG